jgi:hypothetical protein
MSDAQEEITDSQILKLSWRNCVTSNARESLNFLMDHECIEGNRMLKDGRILLLDEQVCTPQDRASNSVAWMSRTNKLMQELIGANSRITLLLLLSILWIIFLIMIELQSLIRRGWLSWEHPLSCWQGVQFSKLCIHTP